MSYSIRLLKKSDCALIGPFLREVWLDAYHGIQTDDELLTQSHKVHKPELVEKEIDDLNIYSVVVEVGGKIVGHARSDREDGVIYISRLYVLRDYYGTGMGKALLAEVDSYFKDDREIWLDVFEDNKRALHFYLSQGYEIMERATEVQTEGEDVFEFKMRKISTRKT